jgi:hypothetical protein
MGRGGYVGHEGIGLEGIDLAQAGLAQAGRERQRGQYSAARGTIESGLFRSDGRVYFIAYPFRTHDRLEGHVDLVDVGPEPARGPIARVERDDDAAFPDRRLLICPGGVMPADLALALLATAGIRSAGRGTDRPTSRTRPPFPNERPCYQEAARLLVEARRPADGVLAGLVGITRVLLELSAEALGSPSSRALLADVVKNLALGVENPQALLPY